MDVSRSCGGGWQAELERPCFLLSLSNAQSHTQCWIGNLLSSVQREHTEPHAQRIKVRGMGISNIVQTQPNPGRRTECITAASSARSHTQTRQPISVMPVRGAQVAAKQAISSLTLPLVSTYLNPLPQTCTLPAPERTDTHIATYQPHPLSSRWKKLSLAAWQYPTLL